MRVSSATLTANMPILTLLDCDLTAEMSSFLTALMGMTWPLTIHHNISNVFTFDGVVEQLRRYMLVGNPNRKI